MPNWANMIGAATRPMLPKSAIRGLQEALAPGSSYDGNDAEPDSDSDDLYGSLGQLPGALRDIAGNVGQHPLETLGGFASGALEGMRGFTSPMDLVLAAAPGALAGRGAGMVAEGALEAAPRLAKMGRQAFDVVEDLPIRQVMPSMDDVAALGGDLKRNLAKIPNATGQMRRPGNPLAGLQSARPELPPEFVPRGGEAAFNATRPAGGGPAVELPPNFAPSHGPYRRKLNPLDR